MSSTGTGTGGDPSGSSSAIVAGKRSRSAIMVDTESGHHLLTIHGYSRTKGIPTGCRVESSPFTIGGHRWHISYYPNGLSSESADYVCVSLILHEDVTAGVMAQWDICLAGEEEEAAQVASLASNPVDNFTSWAGWHYTTFIGREVLERSKHLRHDFFALRCDIVVVRDLRTVVEELLGSEKGADVVFEVGGENVSAHRYVLAARSSVFNAELLGPMKEGSINAAGVVRVEDMEAEVFKALLRFAYTGWLPETWKKKKDEDVMCQHLLVAADRYDMGRLKLICEERLCKYINVGSAANVLALAEQHNCEGLKKACFDFLGSPTNLKSVITTDGFQHLSRSCPSLMIEIVAMSLAAP